MSLGHESGKKDKNDENVSCMTRAREWLFQRNFRLITSLELSMVQAVALFVIEELQRISIITRISVNPTILKSPEMFYVDSICKVLLLDIIEPSNNNSIVMTSLLIVAQLMIIAAIVMPYMGMTLNKLLSKYVITLMEMVLTIPTIIFSCNCIVQRVNIQLNFILYILAISTNIVFETMDFQCSFQRQNSNLFVRCARPVTVKLFTLAMISAFPVLTFLYFPTSFLIYVIVMLLVDLYSWTQFLRKFVYFHELLMNIRGVMLTISISASLCYLAIFILDNAIISQNILLFISSFSLFLGDFFLVFRKNILRNTIINKDLKGQDEIALYCVFYWHCYRQVTQKKNQLYISSLLKKHMNECVEVQCCCKNRQIFYDSNLKIFGNPKMQPHFDKIFIRHYIRKLLRSGYQKFPKSSILTFLLSNYDIQILEMITQTMELIRKLSKMQQKQQLYFSQRFLLFSLRRKIIQKIVDINHKRGNLDLQSVRAFDQELVILSQNLRRSVKNYNVIWKHLQFTKLKEKALFATCRQSLELMFSIESNFKTLKAINTQSTQLRTMMLFYAKLVLHDIHLLSQVKKEIKISHERNTLLGTLEIAGIQLFSNRTMTIVAFEGSKIKWSSKNAASLFQYSRQQFHNLTVKHLMPKYFAQQHDSYVERWKETGHHIKLNKTTYLWGVTRSGHLFSLLMFVKAISLPIQHQYAFFACIEKLDDQMEIVCSSFGEIYGAGKFFCKILKLNPKNLQETSPNLQIFMPSCFDYFLEYFFPNNTKLKNLKKNYETRKEGYFPESLESIFFEIKQDRDLFLRKNKNLDTFRMEYLTFVREKMQQLTCNINGEYISFLITPFKVSKFHREQKQIIVLKVGTIKKDNIEKYYHQLQRTINKLQVLYQEELNSKQKILAKKNKSDFFRAFLNPKRVKRLLSQELNKQQDRKQMGPEEETIAKNGKSTQTIMKHRKLLAQSAQSQIKNERVRYNLWKAKKVLMEEGVISRYTYNLMIGKHAQPNFQSMINVQNNEEDHLKTANQIYEEHLHSEQDKQSFQNDSQGELQANKDNDNETFNSASSSATFISMTNHVKMFKSKLRSLNTPRLLWLLNIALISIVISCVATLIYITVANANNMSIGVQQFQNNMQANQILDSLLICQMNINNFNQKQHPDYKSVRDYAITSIKPIFKQQMILRASQQQIDPNILSYLNIMVYDVLPLTVKEFIEDIFNQIVINFFAHRMIYFKNTILVITKQSTSNVFFDRVWNNIFYMNIIYLSIVIVMFLISLPIIFKLQAKIREIYELLSKISPNEKQRYSKHFNYLNEQFKRKEELNYIDLNNLINIYQNKFKNNRAPTKMDEEFSVQARSNKQKQNQQTSPGVAVDYTIYFKISFIYLLLLSSVVFNYAFFQHYHQQFVSTSQIFTNVFVQQTLMTSSVVESQFEMMGYKHEASITLSGLVAAIYATSQISQVSSQYLQFVKQLTYGTPCNIIPNLSPNSLIFCNKLNNDTFTKGGFDNIYYTQRKLEQRLYQYYAARNFTPNAEQTLEYPNYFRTQEYFELNMGYFYQTLMMHQLYDQIYMEMQRLVAYFSSQLYFAMYVGLALVVCFVVLWAWLYLRLAQEASYINAFLLLIPFDVLSQNPYIKLYIRNQFDYKAANY